MVHQGRSQSAAFYTAGRYGLFDVRNETGRPFRPAGQLPSKNIEQAKRLRSIRIAEALPVKVFRKLRATATLRHESLLSVENDILVSDG